MGISTLFSEHVILFLTFISAGTLQLAGWNALLCIFSPLGAIEEFIALPQIMRWLYGFILLIGNVLLFRFSFVSLFSLYLGILSVPITIGLFALAFQLAYSKITILFPLICIILTMGSVLTGCAGFGFAALLPTDYSGAMSAGLGVSGVVVFLAWSLCIAMYDVAKVEGIKSALWFFFGLVSLLTFLSIALVSWASYKTSLRDVTHNNKETESFNSNANLEANVEDEYLTGGLRALVAKTWSMGIATFSVLFVSLLVFPAVGPVMWLPKEHINLIHTYVGLFIFGDLVGRYIPNVIPSLIVSCKTTQIICQARWFLVLTFILPAVFPKTAILRSTVFLLLNMIVLSFTSGWMSTVTFIRTIEMVNGNAAKKRTATFCLVCVALSILLSQAFGVVIVKIISS